MQRKCRVEPSSYVSRRLYMRVYRFVSEFDCDIISPASVFRYLMLKT